MTAISLVLPFSREPEDARHARSSEPARYGRYLDWLEQPRAVALTAAEDDVGFKRFMREDSPCR